MQDKMKIEIWSDVMCPFCYIGKRKLEKAMQEIDYPDLIEVEWHSFQLNPSLYYKPDRDSYSYLAQLKGQSREWAVMVHNNLTTTAKTLGLDYHFEDCKITNSFDAHRVIQLAKKYRLTNELEEALFKAYFTDGKLISDHATLVGLAVEAGLPEEEVSLVLATHQYSEEVHEDIAEARRLGTTAVPFFVFDRKYAIVGAQDLPVFKETTERALLGWKTRKMISE